MCPFFWGKIIMTLTNASKKYSAEVIPKFISLTAQKVQNIKILNIIPLEKDALSLCIADT
jgi:hypothetical protein